MFEQAKKASFVAIGIAGRLGEQAQVLSRAVAAKAGEQAGVIRRLDARARTWRKLHDDDTLAGLDRDLDDKYAGLF